MGTFEGEWVGTHTNLGGFRDDGSHEFGIVASLSQVGPRVSGTMVDLHPSNTVSLGLVVASSATASWPRWMRANLETFVRNYPDATLRTTVPERSRLVGKAEGRRIAWEKRYLGLGSTVTFAQGRQVSKQAAADVPIEYAGTLSEDGGRIEGEWRIRGRGFFRRRKVVARGEFRLTRRVD